MSLPIHSKRQNLLMEEAKKNTLVRKWAKVLNKIPEVRTASKMSLMSAVCENQLAFMKNSGKSRLLFEEATTTNNIADFTRFALPLLRKSYPKLIADNLVGVQPMSQPASLIFYIRYRYGITKGQTQAGTQIMRQNTSSQFSRQNGWALDPYYSSQTVKDENLTISGGVISGNLAHKPVLSGTVVVNVYAADTDSCNTPTPLVQVSFSSTGAPDNILVSSDATGIVVEASGTEFNQDTGAVTVNFTGSLHSGAYATADYEFDLENNPFQPEITLSIDSDSVSAITRKLKTSWSLEAAQDLKSTQNIDAEATLTDIIGDEIVAEIDREIINDLIIAASVRATHNFATAAGASVNFIDRNVALLYKTLEVANVIHRTTLRGPANWMVTSADLCSKYEQLNEFKASEVLATDGIDVGITNAGSIQNKMKIYKDPLFPNCKVLLGFKGSSALDSGYFYAPYIPLLSTPTVLDPNSFTPNKGVMTRYGKKLIEDGGLFYGTISVSNL